MSLPKLPEPNAFTLDEIAARWLCTEAELIRYFESDMLKIKADLTGRDAIEPGSKAFIAGHENMTYIIMTLNGLYTINQRVVIETWRIGEFSCEESSPKFSLVYDEPYARIELTLSTFIGSHHLRISRQERDRFEAEHHISIEPDNISEVNISKLDSSKYWNGLKILTEKAIDQYPNWEARQRTVQKTSNLNDWLIRTIGANSREAEIIKKVLTEIFNI